MELKDTADSLAPLSFIITTEILDLCVLSDLQGYSLTLSLLVLNFVVLRQGFSTPGWPLTHCVVQNGSELLSLLSLPL